MENNSRHPGIYWDFAVDCETEERLSSQSRGPPFFCRRYHTDPHKMTSYSSKTFILRAFEMNGKV